jgi:predicted metal-binding membrane protein
MAETTSQLKPGPSTGDAPNPLPAEFIAVCGLAFLVGLWATIHFCRSMCCEMDMPGGWTMSMMWMRMRGQTWLGSGISFLLMWLAMMVAMMMPSAFPTFLKTRRRWTGLCGVASGYFTIWLSAGAGVYTFGVAISAVTMRSDTFSRLVPFLIGALLIAAGAVQFTPWKMKHLLRCRSPFGCATACPQSESSFRLGCKQGAACCICCAAPMTVQLTLGMMSPWAMMAVAVAIAAEKLLPRPVIVARVAGVSAVIAGIAYLFVVFLRATQGD